jgi:DNA-binding PadR family transcriptional regulator
MPQSPCAAKVHSESHTRKDLPPKAHQSAKANRHGERPTVDKEGPVINIHTLFEIADLFRFRWDAATLASLADQPLRFRALAKRLGSDLGDRVEDNSLTRSLARLRRGGLIVAGATTIGERVVPLYQLTDQGRTRLAQYRAIVHTYQRLTQQAAAAAASANGTKPRRSGGPPAAQPSSAGATRRTTRGTTEKQGKARR